MDRLNGLTTRSVSDPEVKRNIEDLVPWGLTPREYALLMLHCAAQAGMKLDELGHLAEKFEDVLSGEDIDTFLGKK